MLSCALATHVIDMMGECGGRRGREWLVLLAVKNRVVEIREQQQQQQQQQQTGTSHRGCKCHSQARTTLLPTICYNLVEEYERICENRFVLPTILLWNMSIYPA